MRLEDWREWPADRIAALYGAEFTRWRTELSWDASPLFALVEQARVGGQLPGLVAVDKHGDVAGWSYASVQDGLLFIGALHGDRADVVRKLLDAVLASAEASYARGYRCFLFPGSSAVTAALTRKRFDVQPFLYLQRPIPTGLEDTSIVTRAWKEDDLPQGARLMARSYAGTTEGRCFSPTGRLDEWASYLGQLGHRQACGTFAGDESLVYEPTSLAQDLGAMLIATRLTAETTHVAQIVVDPRLRRQGAAAALVNASAILAARQGARQQTLLVAESNTIARRLYARLGFQQVSQFVYAERSRISRVTSRIPTTQVA